MYTYVGSAGGNIDRSVECDVSVTVTNTLRRNSSTFLWPLREAYSMQFKPDLSVAKIRSVRLSDAIDSTDLQTVSKSPRRAPMCTGLRPLTGDVQGCALCARSKATAFAFPLS
eukprot:289934_1